MAASGQITQLLLAWSEGDQSALEQLIPRVYSELHRLAAHYHRRERPEHALQTTALVNEVYLRLIDTRQVSWQNRSHFFAISARLMRQILVDFARRQGSRKRGGGTPHLTFDEAVPLSGDADPNLLALDEALQKLVEVDERKARVVELRFFGGLSIEETAEVLRVSGETVRRDWRLAKAWLRREMGKFE